MTSPQPPCSPSAGAGPAGTPRAARLAVIGHPVAHSRSPAIHARFSAAEAYPVEYTRVEAPLDGFLATAVAFARGNFTAGVPAHGCNVTVPFKHEAFLACGRLTARAQRAQAVNTIRFESGDPADWLGDNTDGAGLVRDIERNAGIVLRGTRVLLLGAGGAAAGALDALLAAGPQELVVANRTASRAQAMVQRYATAAAQARVALAAATLDDPGTAFDVLVNATAASLQAHVPALPPRILRPGALALDMMYGAAAAPFLLWARAQGAIARDGLGMLVEQAAEGWMTWFGVAPSTAQTLAALRSEVDA